jgi:hypothetical protein
LAPVVFSRKGFPRKNMCLVFDLNLHYLLTRTPPHLYGRASTAMASQASSAALLASGVL